MNPIYLYQKLNNLPSSPGVYKFFDHNHNILYIGKAKNLRSRVRQYFNGDDERRQIPFLIKEMTDFDYTIVNTELESLYLERMLIQKHKPKYNIDLKDDKNFAFIVIDYSKEIPQIIIQRKISLSSQASSLRTNVYFGPFTNAKKIRDLIFVARKTFGLCSSLKTNKPCFYFHLHRCPGVCAGKISIDEYKKHLEKIKLFFLGKLGFNLKNIQKEMQNAARLKKFEKAAMLRDQTQALNMLMQKQTVIMTKPIDWDIVGIAKDEGIWCVNLFKIRAGKLLDKENFIYEALIDDRQQYQQNFLEDYYTQTSDTPKEIFLPFETNNKNLINTLLKDRFKKPVKINIPKRGVAKNLIKLSQTNAEEYLKNYLSEKAGHRDKIQRGLNEIKTTLKLMSLPKRIECFDISNIQGTNPVGSMVVFEDGIPKKTEYRKFKIQSKNSPDDFTMMREVLTRRFSHSQIDPKLQIPNSKSWLLPDLIVIDGGKGQLSVAIEVLKTYNLKLRIPIIGLAKRIEEIFLPNHSKPIILSHESPGLQLLQRLRDEAHRFAITFHRKLRSREAVRSALENIKGIGPKTKKLLKQNFGTTQEIKKASFETLSSIVGNKLAEQIKKTL